MPAEDYFTPTEIDALRMESELLALENTFLKGRIRSLEQSLKLAKDAEARVRQQLEQSREPASDSGLTPPSR
jgi:hypothetical protein